MAFLIGEGQSVTIGLLGAATATNVWSGYGLFATFWDKLILESQYLSLYRAVPPTWSWLPCLAEGFPSAFHEENGYWVATVNLRQGVLWSDGTPFTADDVIFTYNVLLTEVGGTRMASLFGGRWSLFCPESLAYVEKLGDYQVKYAFFRLPNLREWAFGALSCPIVQRDYWEPKFQAAFQTEDPAASLLGLIPEDEPVLGAFRAIAWEPGSSVVFERNPLYYGSGETLVLYEHGGALIYDSMLHLSFEAYGGAQGRKMCELAEGPYIEQLVYRVFSNPEAAFSVLQDGEIAAILCPPESMQNPGEMMEGSGAIEIIANPSPEFFYLAFNMRRKPLDELAFRKALATLIDRELLCQELPGDLVPLYGPVPEINGFWSDPDLPQPERIGPAERVSQAVVLLKEAGFFWDAEPKAVDSEEGRPTIIGVLPNGNEVPAPAGFRLPNGELCPELQLLSVSPDYDPLAATLASLIAARFRELAIPVTVNYVSLQGFLERVWGRDGFDFDLYLFSWPMGDPSFPEYLYFFWHSSQDVPGGFNTPGYHNPLYDQEAEAFFWSQSPEEARKHAILLQKILEEDLPYVFLAMPLLKEAIRTDQLILPYKNVLGGLGYAWPATTIQLRLGE